jgi:hypothetical protein
MYEVDKYTVSLLHFDDGIKDETGKVWTTVGSPSISAIKSKLGRNSCWFDGNSYLETNTNEDFIFGTEDFTIDWWEYKTSAHVYNSISMINNSTTFSLALGGNANNNFYWLSSNGSSWDIAAGTTMGDVILNAWTHYALVRNGDSIMAFQNGVLKSTVKTTASIANINTKLKIGSAVHDGTMIYQYTGYIDELRISKSIARWTTNFDPEPVKTTNLLRITMNDSSEREYRLTSTEVDAFINWYSRTVGTGTTCYTFNDTIDKSKEYLAFEKIISFKVIPTVE